jgi:hypothetical protein
VVGCVVVEPPVDTPVEPLVPELLPAEEVVAGAVEVEPDEPMVDAEPVAVPPAEPMPEAEPDVVPVALQAARAATHSAVNAIFNIINSPV